MAIFGVRFIMVGMEVVVPLVTSRMRNAAAKSKTGSAEKVGVEIKMNRRVDAQIWPSLTGSRAKASATSANFLVSHETLKKFQPYVMSAHLHSNRVFVRKKWRYATSTETSSTNTNMMQNSVTLKYSRNLSHLVRYSTVLLMQTT